MNQRRDLVNDTGVRRSGWDFYEWLLETAPTDSEVQEVVIGLTWTLCRSKGWGLAMSPGTPTRTLPWPGTLEGRSLRELAAWVRSWDAYEATVGMAAINSVINADSDLAASATPLFPSGPANLAVFEHFAACLRGKRVAVVGRYPGLETLELDWHLSILERQPGPGDLPDPAAEYLLPEADWVFLTATSIPNKTFPRLAELSCDAQVVLMGPTAPWLEGLAEYGIDYLAGVVVEEGDALRRTVAEGGGTRIFESGVRYRVLALAESRIDRLRGAIGHTATRRDSLKQAMEHHYSTGASGRSPEWSELEAVDRLLADLDTRFKTVYDAGSGTG
jgi:uncharacterized protein (DUF4213/DUF364 family)